MSCLSTAAQHAVVLVYHHVAEDTPPSTSVTPAAFRAQLDYLVEHEFSVRPLAAILDAIANGQALPERTVAITFDDAYRSVLTTAHTMLAERGWPYTVFVSTDSVDAGSAAFLTWEDLRWLVARGADVGNHGAAHAHSLDLGATEFIEDALRAAARIDEQLGVAVRVFAYPYGEFDVDLERAVQDLGWYGVGQQSGVVSRYASLYSAPRFPISTQFAALDRFAERVHAHPLPIMVAAPNSRVVRAGDPWPNLVLRVVDAWADAASIRCFTSTGAPLSVTQVGPQSISVAARGAVTPGRSKYTCTARVPDSRSYAWYSHLWIAR